MEGERKEREGKEGKGRGICLLLNLGLDTPLRICIKMHITLIIITTITLRSIMVSLGDQCKLPSEVWGKAPTEMEFGAF